MHCSCGSRQQINQICLSDSCSQGRLICQSCSRTTHISCTEVHELSNLDQHIQIMNQQCNIIIDHLNRKFQLFTQITQDLQQGIMQKYLISMVNFNQLNLNQKETVLNDLVQMKKFQQLFYLELENINKVFVEKMEIINQELTLRNIENLQNFQDILERTNSFYDEGYKILSFQAIDYCCQNQ